MQLVEKLYPIDKTFNIAAPPGMQCRGFEISDDPAIPLPRKVPYHFVKEVVRDILAFLHLPAGDGLYLMGPTGAGKSSVMEQILVRLGWPSVSVTGHEQLEIDDLIGQHTLVNGEMKFVYGPLALAWKYGWAFMLDEIDLINPSQLAGLNGILDGRPLVIARNGGEVIPMHPNFRFIATGNSNGGGDSTGNYAGVQIQNIAFLDRFRCIALSYPEPDAELEIIKTTVPELDSKIVRKMIDVANHVRSVFLGGESTITLSTRTLVRWALLTVAYRKGQQPLRHALEVALLARAPKENAEAVNVIARGVFGDNWGSDDNS